MRVRSRLSERHRKKRHDEPKQELPPFYGTAAVALGFERMHFDRKEGVVALFAMTLGGGL